MTDEFRIGESTYYRDGWMWRAVHPDLGDRWCSEREAVLLNHIAFHPLLPNPPSSSSELVEDLRGMADIIDGVNAEDPPVAVVAMLSGSLFDEAADRIERLEAVVAALRDLGFGKDWDSVDRWYGSVWTELHRAMRNLDETGTSSETPAVDPQ